MKLFNLLIKTIISILILASIFINCFENTNTIQLQNKNTATEKSKLNSEIFLTEKVFKYKNVKKAKTENTFTSNKAISNLKTSSKIKTENSLKKKALDIEATGTVLYEGWIKYFKYSEGVINSPLPKGFAINPEFQQQGKNFPNVDFKQKNSDGSYDYIRDETYFYLHLFQNILTINSSKMVK